jgi:hypothetical protein
LSGLLYISPLSPKASLKTVEPITSCHYPKCTLMYVCTIHMTVCLLSSWFVKKKILHCHSHWVNYFLW